MRRCRQEQSTAEGWGEIFDLGVGGKEKAVRFEKSTVSYLVENTVKSSRGGQARR